MIHVNHMSLVHRNEIARVPHSSPAKCGAPGLRAFTEALGCLLPGASSGSQHPHLPSCCQPCGLIPRTPPSLPAQTCSCLLLNSILNGSQATFLSLLTLFLGPKADVLFVLWFSGALVFITAPFQEQSTSPEAGLSCSHRDLTVLPPCHPALISNSLPSGMCASTLLLENKQNHELYCKIYIADLINFGHFHHGFHNYKMLSLGNLEMMVRCCGG